MKLNYKHAISIAFLFIVTLFLCNPIKAIERTWTNTQNNNLWDEPLNWIPIGAPAPGDTLLTDYADDIIITAGTVTEIKHLRLLGDLNIESGATLFITDGNIDVYGDVTNYGTIIINNSPEYGINHNSLQLANNPFLNEGTIIINNAGTAGLFIRFDQVFTNGPGALLQIENSEEESIVLNGQLSNSGTIKARNSSLATGLNMSDENASLINLKCGKILFLDKINITNGMCSNFGFFQQNHNGFNDAADEYFINYGILEDNLGSFQDTDILNLGMWINPYENTIYEGQPILIFENTFFPLDVTASDIFLENTLTTNAGSYDYNSNTWLPNFNAVGNTEFFIEISQDSGSCSDTVRFTVNSAIKEINYWVGDVGVWELGANWSKGTVPVATERVAIFNKDDRVSINSSIEAECNFLILSGKLSIDHLASLTIDSPEDGIGLNIIQGELFNNGALNIHNCTQAIVLANGIMTNNNSLKCMDNETCLELDRKDLLISEVINNGSITSNDGITILSEKSSMKNHGSIVAAYDGVASAIDGDTISNSGSIIVRGIEISQGTGIAGYIENNESGIIDISLFQHGLESYGDNYGVIKIDSCEIGIETQEIILNNKDKGHVEIYKCMIGIQCDNSGFFNQSGGMLFLNENNEGLNIQFPGYLVNYGIYNILNTNGHGIHSTGNLYNQLNGEITISGSNLKGLNIEGNNSGYTGDHSSKITITNSSGVDCYVESGRLFFYGNAQGRFKTISY